MFFELSLAFILGVVVALVWILRSKVGTLKMMASDQEDEPPYLYAKFYRPLDFICNKKYVLLKVDLRNLDSQD